MPKKLLTAACFDTKFATRAVQGEGFRFRLANQGDLRDIIVEVIVGYVKTICSCVGGACGVGLQDRGAGAPGGACGRS